MIFLVFIIIFLSTDLVLVFYLANSEFFSPLSITGDYDLWNIVFFILLISIAIGLFSMLVTYLLEKFLTCGIREFPTKKRAVRYGILFMITTAALLIFHVFHFLNIFVGLVLLAALIIGIMLLG